MTLIIKSKKQVLRLELKKRFKDEVGDYAVMVNKATECYQIVIDEIDGVASCDLLAIFKAVKEYADTPLEERKDEKWWYIHICEDEDEYLNLNKKRGGYDINNQAQTIHHQTKFTRSEIEDWAGTNSDEVIDWIIDKFGEEVK